MTFKLFSGTVISHTDLRSPRAQSLYRYLHSDSCLYFNFIECLATEHTDVLVVEVSVEVHQHRLVDIRPKETIAISFATIEDSLPVFYPLREDFPINLVHVMVDWNKKKPSLCLWDEPFEELRPRLTSLLLLTRLKEWLESASSGTLHQPEQTLEPVLLGYTGQVVIPQDVTASDKRYVGYLSKDGHGRPTYRFSELEASERNSNSPHCILAAFPTPAITHRAAEYAPYNLEQLKALLTDVGFDLKTELTKWVAHCTQQGDFGEAYLVLLINFPKKRSESEEPEASETWAFFLSKKVGEIGEILSLFSNAKKYGHEGFVPLIGVPEENHSWEDIQIDALMVRREVSPDDLAVLSGVCKTPTTMIAAVGAGAIGSQIIELAARCGFGKWIVIDKDILLPHNLVRHILGDWALGMAKADAIRGFINQLVPGSPVTGCLIADVQSPEDNTDQLNDALNSADLILDMSASVSASRALCEHPSTKKRASLFLSPSGHDLVFLLEDTARTTTLWDLEGSYYKALATTPELKEHLGDTAGSRVRYGNGCRDITAQISAAQISALSGIAFPTLTEKIISSDSAAIIWRADFQGGEVKAFQVAIAPAVEFQMGTWRVRWNKQLLSELLEQRSVNLPNETGGILLGIVDLERRMIVVAMDIPAPPDSVKRPHYFERGVTGLHQSFISASSRSAGQLSYLGEWHSHPTGVTAFPSSEDEQVFKELENSFLDTEEPFMMAIIEADQIFFRVGIENENYQQLLRI